MAVAALSLNSMLASPAQINPQVKTDTQPVVPQGAQDAQRTAKSAQTDTITISAQALKMADDKSAVAKEDAKRADAQKALLLASDKTDAAKKATQYNAVKAYAAVSASQ
jgi:predicted secreted protein